MLFVVTTRLQPPPLCQSTSLEIEMSLLRRGTAHGQLVAAGSGVRHVSTGNFAHRPFLFRNMHQHSSMPIHDSNYFGGRSAFLREIGPINAKKRGRKFKKEITICQFNVDIWCAQQTLRKRWKQRDWDVHEIPFRLAPKDLQRVIPDMYTDVPQLTDRANGDWSNIRNKVYDRESLAGFLYPSDEAATIYQPLQLVKQHEMTLDKFL